MTAQELITYLTDGAGLDETTAQAIAKMAQNEKVVSRAATLKQQSEFSSLEQRAADLQAKYEGQSGRPGAKTYQEWYEKNYGTIQKLQTDYTRYQERFGALDDAGNPTKPQPQAFDEAALQKLVDTRIQEQYGPRWSQLLKGSGQIIEKHLRSKRDAPLDWDKISELAATKGGDLNAAYDEWDRPEADKAMKVSQEAEIKRRVDEELKKARTADFFPASADSSPSSSVSPLSRSKVATEPKYDRSKVIQSAMTGEYGPQ